MDFHDIDFVSGLFFAWAAFALVVMVIACAISCKD